jgi:hypothetical protein
MWTADAILEALDRCCDSYTFPMLDNGYIYLAATRLSAFRSDLDWAIVIEVFGFSPRAGLPDVDVTTFASRLRRQNAPEDYASRAAFEHDLALNPNNECRVFNPIAPGDWQDPGNREWVATGASVLSLRDRPVAIPPPSELSRHGIDPSAPPRIQTFELCRYLAATHRDEVLATADERRVSVLPGLPQLLVLDEWHHPNVADDDERPSGSATFQQLARALISGDTTMYRPSAAPNTHWRNWPGGGTL